MNQQTTKPAITPDEVHTAGFRVQVLRVIAAAGMILAALAAADLTGVANILPDPYAGWVLAGGLMASGLKQVLLIIGDLMDNGKQDGSFKIPVILLLGCLACLCLTSCALSVTEDGCLLGSYKHGTGTYQAGPCVGPAGEVNRYRVQWTNDESNVLRATYWVKSNKRMLVEYQVSPGVWVQWSSKSGVMLGSVPPEVQAALEGTPQPIPAPPIGTVAPITP
jgi:hypothetical protein